jgi:hypothetical protein
MDNDEERQDDLKARWRTRLRHVLLAITATAGLVHEALVLTMVLFDTMMNFTRPVLMVCLLW